MSKLYLVPTPIGNLKDITLRAIEVLQQVDLILAEDTRNSGKLLKHYQITTPMHSHHMHNEHKTAEHWVAKLKQNTQIAMITDAGTPAISDPGYLLVREAIAHDITVECLPGATAFVPALVNSGLPNDRFVFEGFLPDKKGRQTKLLQLQTEGRTMIFYVSPHKLIKTIQDFVQYFGPDRKASVSRELTKLFEETQRGTMADLLSYFESKPIKGELVMVVEGLKK